MTRRVTHDLSCVCGRHFRRMLYHSISVAMQPGLRYAILADVLNVVQCPSCERVARVNLPFLYDDKLRRRLIYVYPEVENQPGSEGANIAVQVVDEVPLSELAESGGLSRPSLLFGIEHLSQLVATDLEVEEQLAAVFFDVRPGRVSERAARLLTARIATAVGGYVHSWREGGRLHLQILGPSMLLEEITIESE